MEPATFSPDDTLILCSRDAGNEELEVSYRGPLGTDRSVVFNVKSGMQFFGTYKIAQETRK